MPSKSHNGQNQKRELKRNPPELSMSMFASKADYDKAMQESATDFWLRLEAEEQQRKKEREAK